MQNNGEITYPLTDFSKEELSLLADMIHYRLEYEKGCAKHNIETYPDDEVTRIIQGRYNANITRLRDMNVRVLTSLQIVKEKETTLSN